MLSYPDEWMICFKRRSAYWWVNAWPMQTYRHCLCFTWNHVLEAWLVVEFANQGGSTVSWVKSGEDLPFLAKVTKNSSILKVKAGHHARRLPGLYCVSLVAQVTGVRSCALSVDGFYRDCLAHGAEIVLGDNPMGKDINGRSHNGDGRQNASPAGSGSADSASAGAGHG